MANQRIRYENGTDTGAREDSDAISPYANNERVVDTVLNRPGENLRYRTEVDRTALEELKYRMDEDIRWILTAGDTSGEATGSNMPQITVWDPDFDSGPPERGKFTLGADVAIQPIQTIGSDNKDSFSWTWDDGVTTPAVTLQVDGDLLAAEGGDLVEFRLEYTATTNILTVTKIGDPITTIKIVVSDDGSKTVQDLYDLINGDSDILNLVTFDWGVGNRNTVIDTGTTAPAAGTYDFLETAEKEYHLLQVSTLNAFFTDDALNPLADGETLAVYYPYLVDPDDFFNPGGGTDGGRRQACVTNANVTLTSAMLFNTGREPAKIPLGIPICKRIGADLVFVDGTVIRGELTLSDPPVYLGEHGYTIKRIVDAAGSVNLAAYSTPPTPPTVDTFSLVVDTIQNNLENMTDTLNNKASLNFDETITGDWQFDGHIGVGVAPSGTIQTQIRDAAVNLSSNGWIGLDVYAQATTGGANALVGLNVLTDNTAAITSGNLMYGAVITADANNSVPEVYGALVGIDLHAGTFTNAGGLLVNGQIRNTITSVGTAYGLRVSLDCDTAPTGNAYVLYLRDQSNVDYAIYQNGTAPSYLVGDLTNEGKVAIGTATIDADRQVNIANDAVDLSALTGAAYYGLHSSFTATTGDASNHLYGAYIEARSDAVVNDIYGTFIVGTASEDSDKIRGAYVSTTLSGTAFATELTGIFNTVGNASGTTHTTVRGQLTTVNYNASSAPTDLIGQKIVVNYTGTTPAGDSSGLWIDAGDNLKWSVRQEGASPNVFEGMTTVGSASETVPQTALFVDGGLTAREHIVGISSGKLEIKDRTFIKVTSGTGPVTDFTIDGTPDGVGGQIIWVMNETGSDYVVNDTGNVIIPGAPTSFTMKDGYVHALLYSSGSSSWYFITPPDGLSY